MQIQVITAALATVLLAGPASAVVVDFESDVTIVSYDVPAEWADFGITNETLPVRAMSQGFSFGFRGTEAEWNGETMLRNPAGSLPSDHLSGLIYPFDGSGTTYTIWRDDTALFNLASLDLGLGFNDPLCESICPSYGSATIRGFDEFGAMTASLSVSPGTSLWQTVNFDSSWSELAYVEIGTQTVQPFFGLPYEDSPRLDNFIATVVPIPAAVWLFASGLSVLGLRRSLR